MEVKFDIDQLLEQVREDDVGTIIALINDPEVLDYLAKLYICEEEILMCIVRNWDTRAPTVEYIAKKALENKCTSSLLSRLARDMRVTPSTKQKLEALGY